MDVGRISARALVTAAAAALLLQAVPAGATPTAAATPQSVCGSGYRVIDSLPISTGKLWATVYLLYNGGNGYNCVVTMKATDLGTATYTEARIQVSGSSTIHRDRGNFTTYAGPVRVNAAGKCVQYGGIASDRAGQRFQSLSSWGHCG
ncbi:spore-associated protein A [Nonomuraea sp. LPB2021202275-12-8]|uniref:spore-associated protein A n=1 Tax=Nonomuraea sp. LPB2021202275-12-8 TaxID=3120159 RepID=UPI00300D533E